MLHMLLITLNIHPSLSITLTLLRPKKTDSNNQNELKPSSLQNHVFTMPKKRETKLTWAKQNTEEEEEKINMRSRFDIASGENLVYVDKDIFIFVFSEHDPIPCAATGVRWRIPTTKPRNKQQSLFLYMWFEGVFLRSAVNIRPSSHANWNGNREFS